MRIKKNESALFGYSWKRTLPPHAELARYGIYSASFFACLLQYEKTRSDRANIPISLVTIDTGAVSPNEEGPPMLVDLLKQRIRRSDAIGWLDSRHIAVLLPGTTVHGAEVFATAIVNELPSLDGPVQISTHPTSPALARLDRQPTESARFPFEGNGNGHKVSIDDTLEQTLLPPVPLWKRVLDLTGAAVGGLILAPLFVLVAIFIRLVSPGPALFTQQRVGRGGREFRFFKFRTMHADTDEKLHADYAKRFIQTDGSMEKLDERDPRIFFGGNVLRLLCIDELPQLYNVLRGDMSLVGPRPCIPYEAAEYQRWHRHRFEILPGLTGLWQVSGKNKLSFAEMIRLDIKYQRTMSPLLDLWIILRTPPTIVVLLCEALGRRLVRLRQRLTPRRGAHREPDGEKA